MFNNDSFLSVAKTRNIDLEIRNTSQKPSLSNVHVRLIEQNDRTTVSDVGTKYQHTRSRPDYFDFSRTPATSPKSHGIGLESYRAK
jgi:hypothetical protein